MNIFEKSIDYRAFKISYKKDVAFWRAKSNRQLTIGNREIPIQIDETANTKEEAIKKARLKLIDN